MSKRPQKEVIELSSSSTSSSDDDDDFGRRRDNRPLPSSRAQLKSKVKKVAEKPKIVLPKVIKRFPTPPKVFSPPRNLAAAQTAFLVESDDEDELPDIDAMPPILSPKKTSPPRNWPSHSTKPSATIVRDPVVDPAKSEWKTYPSCSTSQQSTVGGGQSASAGSSQQLYGEGDRGRGQSSSAGSSQSQQSSQSEKSKKEPLKEESERRKAEKLLEREMKKTELAREKELKKSENELRKNAKPGEAHKFITIVMDVNVPRKDDLVQVLDTAGIKYEFNFVPLVSNSFLFKRETVHRAMGDDLHLHQVSKFEEENQVMILLDHEEIVRKIAVQISESPVPGCEDELDMITFVNSVATTYPSKKITLFLHGMEGYFKKLKKNTQQEFRQRVLNGDQEKKSRKKKSQLPTLSRLEFQNALVQLQLETDVNFRLVNTVNELGTMLAQYTKSIAEAPFKQQRKELGFDWYAAADTAGSVKIDKDGKGLKRLWIEQLCLFSGVGSDTALAISAKYPTPQHLITAYSNCDTQEEGESLIRDLQVRMGVGPLAKTRRIGPELSKKMYRFFTSSDAERNLGSSQNI